MRSLTTFVLGLWLAVATSIALFPYVPEPVPTPEAVPIYMVFDVNPFAPNTGFGSYVGSFPSIQEATSYMNKTCGGGSAHIIEVDTNAKPENAVAFKFNYQRVPSGEYLFSGREVRKDGLWVRD